MADFNFSIHHCTQTKKQYNVLRTDMEGFKVKKRLKSTLPVRMWECELRLLSNTERNAILAHYDGQYGETIPFDWTSIPEHISSESSISVFYYSYEEEVIANNVYNIIIEFEESL